VLPAIIIHDTFKLAQRVILATTAESGSIIKWNCESSTFTLAMDTGNITDNIPASDLTGFAEGTDNNQRLDFVSRIIWVIALSENRIPMTGAHLDPEFGSWTIFEQAFQLNTPWTADLWTARPTLIALNFEWWVYLFAESARTKLKGVNYLALLMIEESYKHVAIVEELFQNNHQDDLVVSFIEGIADLVTYYPTAVHALGLNNNQNGAFSLLRHIVSTQALKILRAVYRNPKTDQYDIDRQLLLQRYKFYLDLQKNAEDELRSRQCTAVFGDGQSNWNAAWLYSLNCSDRRTVCYYLRQGIALADEGKNNDFVSAKARWDLAGNLMLGGESDPYDTREICTLRDEAQSFEVDISSIGMQFYVHGESIFAKMVIEQLSQFDGRAPFMRQALKIKTYADDGLPVCHYCQKGTKSVKACGACKKIKYCSRECQKSDFKVHKKVCKKLALK
jgi:hypothetical protein